MELKEVSLSKEQARQLENDLVAYSFAVRDVVRRNLETVRMLGRPHTGKGPFRRELAVMPPVPHSFEVLK